MMDDSPANLKPMLKPLLREYMSLDTCPDLISLDDYFQHRLSEAEQAEIDHHLKTCPACQAKADQLTEPLILPDWPLPDWTQPNLLPPGEIAAHSHAPEPTPAPAAGQLWTLAESWELPPGLALPALAPAPTGGPSVWLILEVGPLHFGQYQEVQLAPLSEKLAFASHRDLILNATDTPFAEPLMVECWNAQRSLSGLLDHCLGSVSAEVLAHVRLAQLNQAHSGLRGGTPTGPDSLVYEFQAHEKTATAPLSAVYEAFQALRRAASQAFIYITPQGLKAPAEVPTSPFFAQLNAQSQAPLWAASHQAATPPSPESHKARLTLSEAPGMEIQMEIWLEGENLVFFCSGAEQEGIQGLEIHYLTPEHTPAQVSTNRWGSAQIPLAALRPAENLLTFQHQGERWHYPFFRGDSDSEASH